MKQDYKRILTDRSNEFNDIEAPKAESYIDYKNRLALDAWRERRCREHIEPRKSWLRRVLGL